MYELITSICTSFGIPVPNIIIGELEPGVRGKFVYSNYTIYIKIDSRKRMIEAAYHEYRHAWQYQYYELLYLVGVTNRFPCRYHSDYEKVLEEDALCFGKSHGRDNREHLLRSAYERVCYDLFGHNQDGLEYALLRGGHPRLS